MTWNFIVLRSDLPDVEVSAFMNDLEHERMRESEPSKEYVVHLGKAESGERVIMIPPDTLHFVERMPVWKPHSDCARRPRT